LHLRGDVRFRPLAARQKVQALQVIHEGACHFHA
jgi:hypothetical protein